jgi:hypothetical protein
MIVMAHLKTKATTGNPEQREVWKWSLIRGLYDRGLTREKIIKLFQIIDRMMTLPKFEEQRTMPLLSNMEIRGMERGKEIGALQNARDYIKAVLRVRLGKIPLEIETYLMQTADLSILDKLLILAATTNSFEDFKQSIE